MRTLKALFLLGLLLLAFPLKAQLLVKSFTTSNYLNNTVGAPLGNWSSTGASAMVTGNACTYVGTYADSGMSGCCYNYYISGAQYMSGTAYAVGGYYSVNDTASINCLITWAAEGGPNTNGIYVLPGGQVEFVHGNSISTTSGVTISTGQCVYVGMATDGINIYGWVFNSSLTGQAPTITIPYTGLSGYVDRIVFHNTVNSSDNSYMRATLNDLVMYNNYVSYAPFDGPTPTPTPTTTPTATPTPTQTKTFTASPTNSPVFTLTKTISTTLTQTRTTTRTPTTTATRTVTKTPTRTPSASPTRTVTVTPSATRTPSPTRTATRTPTGLPTATVTETPGTAGTHVITEQIGQHGVSGPVQTLTLAHTPLCLIQVYWHNDSNNTSGTTTFVPSKFFIFNGCTISNAGTVKVGASFSPSDYVEFYVTYCY